MMKRGLTQNKRRLKTVILYLGIVSLCENLR